MSNLKREKASDWLALVESLKKSDLGELDQVAIAYKWILDKHIEQGKNQIELARAMKDQETVIREQIKMETIKYTVKSFDDCVVMLLGRKVGDE